MSIRAARDRRGFIFALSFLVITVLVLLGTAFAVLSAGEQRVAERQRRTLRAFATAEAGLERAFYDLRQDFINDSSSPSWTDGDINGFTITGLPLDGNGYYTMPYVSDTSVNSGTYAVKMKNVDGSSIWVDSTGTIGDVTQTIRTYVKIKNFSVWNNAIFAGAGAAGAMVNGNVDIRGSVHILANGLQPTDYVVDLGGTAELVGNNYSTLAAALKAKVPALPTTVVNGETVETLGAELRVKKGIVGLSGSATAGEVDVAGNAYKETIDGSYVTNGFGGNKGTANVHSDNSWSNTYDLGDSVSFPSLSDPYPGYSTYQEYIRANALVITDAAQRTQLANITPSSNFSYSSAQGTISMNGSGALTISGIVYIDGGTLGMSGGTITYTGKGSILATGDVQIDTSLVTSGNNSFPTNVIGVMTPGTIDFNAAGIDVMGLFYGEDTIQVQKQTDVVGSIVSNYFDMGTNVPAIFQVPEAANNLPPGMITGDDTWTLRVVVWQR